MCFKTFSTYHIKVYFGFGGFLLKKHIIKLHTEICFPTGFPSTRLWQAEIADLLELVVEYSYLFSNKLSRKLNTKFILHVTGSIYCSLHQLTHFFQVHW